MLLAVDTVIAETAELQRRQRVARKVHLVYADDSARDNRWQVIGALIMPSGHFDNFEWNLAAIIEMCVPEDLWGNFEFHASELWNRDGPFKSLEESQVRELFNSAITNLVMWELSVVYGAVDVNKLALRENSEKRPIGGGLSVLPSWDCWHQDSGLGRTI